MTVKPKANEIEPIRFFMLLIFIPAVEKTALARGWQKRK
jgi:hypothetical protein